MYALVDYIGQQILLKEGEKIRIPFLDKKIGTKITFDNVIFYDDGKSKKVGTPYIKSLSFSGKLDSHGKDKKILVFKKKRRKGHQKKNGHVQKFSYVTIDKFSSTKAKSTKKAVTKKTESKKATGTKSKSTAKKTTQKK